MRALCSVSCYWWGWPSSRPLRSSRCPASHAPPSCASSSSPSSSYVSLPATLSMPCPHSHLCVLVHHRHLPDSHHQPLRDVPPRDRPRDAEHGGGESRVLRSPRRTRVPLRRSAHEHERSPCVRHGHVGRPPGEGPEAQVHCAPTRCCSRRRDEGEKLVEEHQARCLGIKYRAFKCQCHAGSFLRYRKPVRRRLTETGLLASTAL